MTDQTTYTYDCSICGKRFRSSGFSSHATTSCAVLHGPGECCHYTDEELAEPIVVDGEGFNIPSVPLSKPWIMHDFRCHIVNCGFDPRPNSTNFWVVCSCGWSMYGLFFQEVMESFLEHKDHDA